MKRVTVRYFAVLRERRGLSEETVETTASTLGEFLTELIATHRLGLPISLIRVAVGTDFAENSQELKDGMHLVLIPPVAGG